MWLDWVALIDGLAGRSSTGRPFRRLPPRDIRIVRRFGFGNRASYAIGVTRKRKYGVRNRLGEIDGLVALR
ncbi:hypothetical protein SVXHr_2827 [Halorhabdus sp. SVX81]|nr:hypothetical protein SVXHr_2827 [Halorhabdus sp. SVX81]